MHLGGDEAVDAAWSFKPSIPAFMKANNISDYGELMYWYQTK